MSLNAKTQRFRWAILPILSLPSADGAGEKPTSSVGHPHPPHFADSLHRNAFRPVFPKSMTETLPRVKGYFSPSPRRG